MSDQSGRVLSDYPHRWTPENGICRYCGQTEAICPGIGKPGRGLSPKHPFPYGTHVVTTMVRRDPYTPTSMRENSEMGSLPPASEQATP